MSNELLFIYLSVRNFGDNFPTLTHQPFFILHVRSDTKLSSSTVSFCIRLDFSLQTALIFYLSVLLFFPSK
jgi:hypothetical protein